MAKKLKRVDGVSNKRVARVPGEKPAKAGRSASARTGSPGTGAEEWPGAPARVEKRRRSASVRAKPQDPGNAVGTASREAGKRRREVAVKQAKGTRARDEGGAGKRGRETPNGKRDWRSVSPRIVIVAILLAVFIAMSASPVARNMEATGQLRAMEKELAAQIKTTKQLEREVRQARSLDYIEQEARRQRLVAPGEVLYLVTTEAEGPEVEYRVKAFQSMDEVWERVRRMLHCTAERQVGGE